MDDILITKAGVLIDKFVTAAIPIAKQAYEIGLTTLQVDAVATLAPALLATILSFFFIKKFNKALTKEMQYWEASIVVWKEARKTNQYLDKPKEPSQDFGSVSFVYICLAIPGIIGVVNLCRVWLWVKLFAPQLWLAHAAIEKVLP